MDEKAGPGVPAPPPSGGPQSIEQGFETLRARIATEGRCLRFENGDYGIFDPALVTRIEADNYRGVGVPGQLKSGNENATGTTWAEVRDALIRTGTAHNSPDHLLPLQARMRTYLAAHGGRDQNLTLLIEKTVSHALVSMVIAGVEGRALRWILIDQATKLTNLVTPLTVKFGPARKAADALRQVRAGFAVRRHLAARRSGRIPPQVDSAQAILDFGDRLTPAQAAYAVMTVLTAVSGAPGSVAACLAFELSRRPDWRAKVTEELSGIDDATLCASPARNAPLTNRVVREVLRLWSFPMMSHRRALRPLACGPVELAVGEHYHLSSFITHRDPQYWTDPEAFDPDRWRAGAAPAETGASVPFGWAKRSCVGAALGFTQLMLFARLITQEFRVEPDDPAKAWMRLEGAALPADFEGRIVPA
jgi:cytochrome P450